MIWNANARQDDELSFDDSERFEEDSQTSWGESTDGINQNWRGWIACPSSGEAIQPGLSCVVYQYQYPPSGRFSSASTNTIVHHQQHSKRSDGGLLSLAEISARVCAEKWSFQQLEDMYHYICASRTQVGGVPMPTTIPEKIFLSFIVHCFPQSTDEIRMYSTLANGTCEQFNCGNSLYQLGAVKDVSQTGFLLSANVMNTTTADITITSMSKTYEVSKPSPPREKDSFHVTVKVDRCRIVECTCECSSRSSWCQHVVALCIYRIHQRHTIKFNETIADAINSMSDFELRKLVQWHINEIPRKCIPGFQNLIDQIKDPLSEINKIDGAPDPTDGGHAPVSRFDFPEIEDKVRRLLCKYCLPLPSVHCDVQYLNTTQHPTSIEWNSLIKPLRAREPEGMWNLLQMVREMFVRSDDNAVALLRTITDECLSNTQVILWWYITKLAQSGSWTQLNNGKILKTQIVAQYNCSQLCDEVVNLWRSVAMNPRASKFYRSQLAAYIQDYHRTAVHRLKALISGGITNEVDKNTTDTTVLSNHQTGLVLQGIYDNEDKQHLSANNMRFTVDLFPGFYPALQMCHFLCENNINFGVPADAFFDVAAPNLTKTVQKVPPKLKSATSSKKKKKRSKNRHRQHATQDPLEGPSSQYEEINKAWRIVYDSENMMKTQHQESTESGQESDVTQPLRVPTEEPSSSSSSQARRKKVDSVEMDINEVLAAAFTPLDTIEQKFLKCDAFSTHGYRVDAIEYSKGMINYLVESLVEQSQSFTLGKEESKSPDDASTDSEQTVEQEVRKCNKLLATLEKILYLTKVLRAVNNMHLEVFSLTLKALQVTKYPLATKHQQIMLYYLEAEFVAILQQLSISAPIGSNEMEEVRSVARDLIHTNAGNNGDVPPIALAQFVFETLHSPSDELQVSSTNSNIRRLQKPLDDELALQTALNLLGCSPAFSESYYSIHCEAIRREKMDLAAMLLTRFKDSHEKLGLILDKILDPNLHQMYSNHASNAAYFLERCPMYRKYHKNRQRPTYPYRPEDEVALRRRVEMEEEMRKMNLMAAAPISRGTSDEGMQSSSSSEAGLSEMLKNNTQQQKWNRDMKKRYRRRPNPVNSITEVHVHHMNELAKKILSEAGGQQSNMFSFGGNGLITSTHRKLHLCAVLISVYSMGMNNRISPSWSTRTYNNSASWIAGQVQDIGPMCVEMIRETWVSHFTPSEIASISDKASPSADPQMRKEAVQLALSVLPYAHALSDEEIVSALEKCRDDSREMLMQALIAIETPQFRSIARMKPLFTVMQHWLDLNLEDETQFAVQQQLQHQQQQHQQQQFMANQYRVPPQMYHPYYAIPVMYNQIAPPPVQQQQCQQPPPPENQYLQAQGNDNRMHQSHSAPQLGGEAGPSQQEARSNENGGEETPLVHAFNIGIQAMDCMATSFGEERHAYLKFGENPPYSDEIKKVYHVAAQLGINQLLMFFNTAVRSILSPYVLHQYAKDSMKFFPPNSYLPHMPARQNSVYPIPLLRPNVPPPMAPPPNTQMYRTQMIKFSSPGIISNFFVTSGYHQVTGELFERTCEQYLQAILNKMNNPRLNDYTELCTLISLSYEAFKWIPTPMSPNLFEDFVRTFKKQKAFKKEMAHAINGVLNQLC